MKMYLKMIPEDYVINATMKCLWTLQSDFVIKAIKIKNDSSEPIVIKKITFEVKSQGRIIKAKVSCGMSFPMSCIW
jgi:hypothetical protein